jgi:hypothetical protein
MNHESGLSVGNELVSLLSLGVDWVMDALVTLQIILSIESRTREIDDLGTTWF